MPSVRSFLFTSEAVGLGHPDKMCDRVSDAVLDACLKDDPNSRVACETATKGNRIILLGEISTDSKVDFEAVARQAARECGFISDESGLNCDTCAVDVYIEQQSQEIANAVHVAKNAETFGAGDQGLMFGYACNETEELLPLSYVLSQKIVKLLADLRESGEVEWLLPDCKSQVTVEYLYENSNPIPIRVHTVLVSTQHKDNVTNEEIREALMPHITSVLPRDMFDEETIYHINPSGRFTLGGPAADAGLTGRKIIVDTYGGWGAHGGGAFSGKDATKVDRSAAYAARWIAKSLVHAQLCTRIMVQISYAIGLAQPLSVFVDSYGTGRFDDELLTQIVADNFDLRPGCIIRDLGLQRPIFTPTSCFGHFGRNEFPWEDPKKLTFDFHSTMEGSIGYSSSYPEY
ncbi:hypothetical protein PCE1_003985 [Barthelona sp. PCE]